MTTIAMNLFRFNCKCDDACFIIFMLKSIKYVYKSLIFFTYRIPAKIFIAMITNGFYKPCSSSVDQFWQTLIIIQYVLDRDAPSLTSVQPLLHSWYNLEVLIMAVFRLHREKSVHEYVLVVSMYEPCYVVPFDPRLSIIMLSLVLTFLCWHLSRCSKKRQERLNK